MPSSSLSSWCFPWSWSTAICAKNLKKSSPGHHDMPFLLRSKRSVKIIITKPIVVCHDRYPEGARCLSIRLMGKKMAEQSYLSLDRQRQIWQTILLKIIKIKTDHHLNYDGKHFWCQNLALWYKNPEWKGFILKKSLICRSLLWFLTWNEI